MSKPVPDSGQPCDLTYLEWAGGYYAKLDGGEEDTTIRPMKTRQRRKKKKPPEQPDRGPGENQTGPDLLDWLNRTFDD